MSRTSKIVTTGAIILGLAGAAIGAASGARLYMAKSERPATTDCIHTTGVVHTVRIEQGAALPEMTRAHRCDTLTILNADAVERRLAFGVHSHHAAYGGTTEKTVGQGGSMTVTLTRAGEFMFHDHYDDAVRGHFVVTD